MSTGFDAAHVFSQAIAFFQEESENKSHLISELLCMPGHRTAIEISATLSA